MGIMNLEVSFLLALQLIVLQADSPLGEDSTLTTNNGGWKLITESPITLDGPCTIERINADDFSQEHFLKRFAFTKPVIISNFRINSEFRNKCRRSSLLSEWGEVPVILSSANTYSYRKVDSTLFEYIKNMAPQEEQVLGNETLYLFGDIDQRKWKPLLDTYKKPRWTIPDHDTALSFGIAAVGTGVPFHFHGPGFGEVIYGSKYWFLYPFEQRPEFHPDISTLFWSRNVLPKLHVKERPLQCLLKAGELIYFPDKWWHATLNAQTSVFISTFLSTSSLARTKTDL